MSTRIRILPENLTNKIAAGEVVERPASVVKELVENSLDAGCTEIIVEIESGGKRLIKVADNGCGMSRDDALLSLERHATSKIIADNDLFNLSTLGFRGEALPSIASVSRFTLETRESGSLEGSHIYAEGGRIKEVKVCGMAGGTVISVRNLFFNTPARLKFMKSSDTESGHIGDIMTRLAICRPDVRFVYSNDGKLVLRMVDTDLKERISSLFGHSFAADFYPVEFEDEHAGITGFVAKPDSNRSSTSHFYTYINGRFIRDRVVQHAILQAYRNLLARGRYPMVVLFINVPAGDVDVNVHPTKHEVRFREQGKVHDAIVSAIVAVLRDAPWMRHGLVAKTGIYQESKLPVSDRRVEEVLELPEDFRNSAVPGVGIVPLENRQDHTPLPKNEPDAAIGESTRGYFSSLMYIGQYQGQYILCQDASDLVIIDQHAAHERIVFEKLIREFASDSIESQQLLLPQTLELSFKEASALRENKSGIRQFGYGVEEFSGNTWVLNAVPGLLAQGDYVRVLRDIIEDMQNLGRSGGFDQALEKICARIACHSVIRGVWQLALQEVTSLFAQLDKTEFSGNCPHGRPVLRKLTISEIEKMFKRG